MDVIVIAIGAILAGADGPTDDASGCQAPRRFAGQHNVGEFFVLERQVRKFERAVQSRAFDADGAMTPIVLRHRTGVVVRARCGSMGAQIEA